MKRIFLLTLAPLFAFAAGPAPYPVSVNSQSPVVTSLQSYQANERTFRVTFKDGTNAVDLTGYVPAMSWATTNTATNVATSSWAYVNSSTSGIVDFTFTPAAMNTNGTFIYEVGVAGLPFVYRQGVFTIISSPMGNGAAALTFTNPASYVATVGSTVPGIGFDQATGAAVLTGNIAAASGSITGNQHNAILGGLTISNGLQFATNTALTYSAGRVGWDTNEATLTLTMADTNVRMQVGMEMYLYGQNKSGMAITNGTLLKLVNDPGGTTPRFDRASATNATNAGHFIGMATMDAGSDSNLYVTAFGAVHDLSLPTTYYTNGADLYLDGEGTFTNAPAAYPAKSTHVGYVIRAHSSAGIAWIHQGVPEMDPYWMAFSNRLLNGKLDTNGVQAGGLGGVVITNANGFAYISATNTGGGGSADATNVASGASIAYQPQSTNAVWRTLSQYARTNSPGIEDQALAFDYNGIFNPAVPSWTITDTNNVFLRIAFEPDWYDNFEFNIDLANRFMSTNSASAAGTLGGLPWSRVLASYYDWTDDDWYWRYAGWITEETTNYAHIRLRTNRKYVNSTAFDVFVSADDYNIGHFGMTSNGSMSVASTAPLFGIGTINDTPMILGQNNSERARITSAGLVVSQSVTAGSFAGNGSGLTGLNGAAITNFSGGSVTLTSNVVWKVPSMRGAWDISTDVPAGGGVSLGFETPFTTSTTYRASIRTLSTAATYRVAQGAAMCLSSVATNRGTVFIDYVAWTNTATNSVWFTPFDGTNRLATVNLTTTAVYQVDGSGWGTRAVIPFFAGNQVAVGAASTNAARSFLPPIGEVER
jgi:hypothetical protein